MIASAFFYSLQYLDIKTISSLYGISTITFFRGFVGMLLCCLGLQCKNFWGEKKKLLLLRGIFGALSIIGSFLSVKNLNLSIATVLLSTAPVFTGMMACYLKNSWNIKNWFSLMFCLLGILFITVPGWKENNKHILIGFCSGLASSFFTALVNVTIQEIKEENTFTITLYSMTACSLMILPTTLMETILYHKAFSTYPLHLVQLFGSGFLSFLAQYFKIKAIVKAENVSVVIYRYFDIFFSLLWDVFLFQTILTLYDYLGIIFILTGGFIHSFSF